jgi:hypothetical protein
MITLVAGRVQSPPTDGEAPRSQGNRLLLPPKVVPASQPLDRRAPIIDRSQ